MSGYNDGSSFGYDEINPYDHIPISFEQAKISGRPMLLARDEYPRISAGPLEEISQKPSRESFSRAPKFSLGLTSEDQQTLLIFLLALVVVMQIRIMMQLDQPRGHHYPVMMHTVPVQSTVIVPPQ